MVLFPSIENAAIDSAEAKDIENRHPAASARGPATVGGQA